MFITGIEVWDYSVFVCGCVIEWGAVLQRSPRMYESVQNGIKNGNLSFLY